MVLIVETAYPSDEYGEADGQHSRCYPRNTAVQSEAQAVKVGEHYDKTYGCTQSRGKHKAYFFRRPEDSIKQSRPEHQKLDKSAVGDLAEYQPQDQNCGDEDIKLYLRKEQRAVKGRIAVCGKKRRDHQPRKQ